MKHTRKWVAALLASVVGVTLAGCGGGGGDADSQPAIRFAAEGFWGGPDVNASPVGLDTPPWNGPTGHFWGDPSSPGDHIGLVVLSTGDAWGVYTADDVVVGALHGTVTTSGGTGVAINNAQFFNMSNSGYSVSYTGAVAPRSQLDITNTDGTQHFVGVYNASYDQAASLAQLAGNYTGTGGTSLGQNPGTHYSISISGSGNITMPPDAVGCSASGAVAPHTDKNVFDLSLRFSGANCALGNGAVVNGIAVLANDGHLLLEGATPGYGAMFIYVSN
ncbi:MAG: hypothetical protein LBH31_06305 [Burkholderiaceae bacterium]|jgi:hypothetical protein|nr:hypothetical protein [Burkholderiaceae bacterium]